MKKLLWQEGRLSTSRLHWYAHGRGGISFYDNKNDNNDDGKATREHFSAKPENCVPLLNVSSFPTKLFNIWPGKHSCSRVIPIGLFQNLHKSKRTRKHFPLSPQYNSTWDATRHSTHCSAKKSKNFFRNFAGSSVQTTVLILCREKKIPVATCTCTSALQFVKAPEWHFQSHLKFKLNKTKTMIDLNCITCTHVFSGGSKYMQWGGGWGRRSK